MLVDLTEFPDPAAAGKRELELVREVRESAGMAALIGAEGEAAWADHDAIEAEFGEKLMAEVAAAFDAGQLPTASADTLAGRVASLGGVPQPTRPSAGAIDISIFADTGFTTTVIMSLFTEAVQRAAENGSATLPRQERIDQTTGGLRQQVDLSTTFIVLTGGGKVSVDIIMSATDRISDAATGSFVALYTSTSNGHFDVDACPDESGVAAGTYTFETKHELNDVSTATASQAGGGRAVKAPFRLIDGDDAHLLEIQADLDLSAGARGPGTAGGPGPTAPFDWSAAQQVQIVMPAAGGSTWSGGSPTVTGSGGAGAGGAMFFSSAMAQLFIGQVGKEAERFWRSGECVKLVPSQESRKVDPDEQIELTVEAKEALGDGGEIDAPIVATFTGKASLDPAGVPVDAPAKFTFKAGSEPEDKGTIELEQISVRGIGRTKVEFTVKPQDYKVTAFVAAGGLTATKCDGHEGAWTVTSTGAGTTGTMTFTFAEGSTTADVHAVYDLGAGGGTVKWDMRGPVTFVDGDPPMLKFGKLAGSATVKAGGQTVTTRSSSRLSTARSRLAPSTHSGNRIISSRGVADVAVETGNGTLPDRCRHRARSPDVHCSRRPRHAGPTRRARPRPVRGRRSQEGRRSATGREVRVRQHQLPVLSMGEGILETRPGGYHPIGDNPPRRPSSTPSSVDRDAWLASISKRGG
jgi:hypothetical protein